VSSLPEQHLTRRQRDALRWRIYHLALCEKKLTDEESESHNELNEQQLKLAREALVRGIIKLLLDYETNNHRAKNERVMNHWKNQLNYYRFQLKPKEKKRRLGSVSLDVLTNGLETTHVLMDTASTASEVIANASYLAGGASWDVLDQEPGLVRESLGSICFGVSIALQSVFFVKDIIVLLIDRVKHPHKSIKAKLIEGGRWCRMLKNILFVTFLSIHFVHEFNLMTICILGCVGMLSTRLIGIGCRVHELKKLEGLHEQLLKEKNDVEFNEEGSLRGEISLNPKCQLARAMLESSKRKIATRKKMLVSVACLAVLGMCASTFLALGASSVPFLVSGAALTALILAVELFHMRKKIKAFPALVKRMCGLTQEVIRKQIVDKAIEGDPPMTEIAEV